MDFFTVYQLDTLREDPSALPTIRTVSHRAEIALDSLLKLCLACEAARLVSFKRIARRVVLHPEFKDNLIGIKCVRYTEDTDRHNFFHPCTLISAKALIRLLNFEQRLVR